MMWTEHDDVAAEVEMGELLYGFIRMLKPALVVETGTYKGHTTRQLSKAVFDNGFGRLVTCDPYTYEGEVIGYGAVEFSKCSSLDLPELREADFVFSDSDQNLRQAEYELVKPGCVFVLHDTDRTYSHLHPDPFWLGNWVKEMGGLVFHAGRGFGLLVKP